jgi:hypothetical protein
MSARAEAAELGLKLYKSTCSRCGDCDRRVDSGSCVSCAKARRKKVYAEQKRVDGSILFSKHCAFCATETEHYSSNGNCKPCANKRSIEHYLANREKFMAEFKAAYQENKKKRNLQSSAWYQKNKSKMLDYCKQYKAENKDKIKLWRKTESAMIAHRARQSSKYKTPEGKAEMSIRNMVYRILTGERCRKAVQLVGYLPSDLVSRIESQFTAGMSWSNYGDWHIDHIVPVKFLISNGINCPSLVNSLKNLQPLWAADNISKHAKFSGTVEDAIKIIKGEKC